MTFRELITKWGFETDTKPIENVERALEKIQHRLDFLVASAVMHKVFELTEQFAHFAEELHVAAMSAGITVEAFQKLAGAGMKSAVTQEEMGGAMARLSRHLYQARMGSKDAVEAFQQVGFTFDQIHSFRTGSDVMLALADRFKGIQDPIQKQALAMQLMGRGSFNMVAFLSQGSSAIKQMGIESEKAGMILSEHQVGALVKVEHAMLSLFRLFKVVGATIASEFAPSVETAIRDFLKFYEANRKLIETNIRAWVYDLTYALGFVYQAVKFVVQEFFNFAKSHEVLVRRASEFVAMMVLVVSAIFIATTVFGFLGSALSLLAIPLAIVSTLFGIMTSPIFLMIAGIGALVVAVHDLWTILSGGKWEDTWLSSAYEAVKGFGVKALNFAKGGGLGETVKGGLSSGLEYLESFTGLTSAPTKNNNTNIGPQSTSIHAPINITVPPGTDPKTAARMVKEGVATHLDKINRRTQLSFTPAQFY